jgi:hypothetical protein
LRLGRALVALHQGAQLTVRHYFRNAPPRVGVSLAIDTENWSPVMANETNPVFGTTPNLDRSLGAGLHQLRSKWGWIVASGVVFLIGGVLAFGYTGLATLASIFVLGVALIAAGCAEALLAFNMRDWPHFLMWLVLGSPACWRWPTPGSRRSSTRGCWRRRSSASALPASS